MVIWGSGGLDWKNGDYFCLDDCHRISRCMVACHQSVFELSGAEDSWVLKSVVHDLAPDNHRPLELIHLMFRRGGRTNIVESTSKYQDRPFLLSLSRGTNESSGS
jgi:hypothetical protein